MSTEPIGTEEINAVRRNLTQLELILMDRDDMDLDELRVKYTEVFQGTLALGERIAP